MLPPAVAVLNTAWVWLWVLWSVRAVPPQVVAHPLSPFLLGFLLLAGFAVTRWALAGAGAPQLYGRPVDPRVLVTIIGLLLVTAAIWLTYASVGPLALLHEIVDWGNFISPVFLGLLACAFLWLQGIQLGRSALPQESLERAFYRGILALGLLFMVNQLRPLIATAEALTAALAFFATGLAGLALVSVENARRAEPGLSGAWPALNRYWLGTVASVIGSILLAGLLVAGLLSPDAFERVASVVNLAVDIVTVVIVILAGTLAFVLSYLLAPLLKYLAEVLRQIDLRLPAMPNLPDASRQTLDFFAQHPTLNFARRGLVLALIVTALVLAFWWAVRRFRGRSRRDSDETRDSIATPALLWAQLKNLFQRRRRVTATPAFLSLYGAGDDPRLMVRRAYQMLLEWAPRFSLPARQASQTPAAYAETLGTALPEGRAEIDTLTSVYIQARYAADPPTLDAARAAAGAFQQLRAVSGRLERTSGTS